MFDDKKSLIEQTGVRRSIQDQNGHYDEKFISQELIRLRCSLERKAM